MWVGLDDLQFCYSNSNSKHASVFSWSIFWKSTLLHRILQFIVGSRTSDTMTLLTDLQGTLRNIVCKQVDPRSSVLLSSGTELFQERRILFRGQGLFRIASFPPLHPAATSLSPSILYWERNDNFQLVTEREAGQVKA